MPMTVDLVVPVRRISPAGEHCFFGYYDVPAATSVGRHLGHRVGFRDRFPTPADRATLGWTDVSNEGSPESQPVPFQAFAQTRAWNFQQGAMLQWLSSPPDTCIYNVFEAGRFGSCVHNVRTGEQRRLPMPVASVARDCRSALCINMARVYDFRPGYGYEEVPDPFAGRAAPEEDGVFLMDVSTGDNRLILSLAQAVDFLEHAGEKVGGRKVVVNHITWNPGATRFMFLLRTFPAPGEHWRTFLLTVSRNGDDIRNHPVWDYASHYHWRDDENLLAYLRSAPAGRGELTLLNIADGSRALVDPDYFRADGHCSYSPDKRWILYDSYPDTSTADCLRSLQVYSLDRRKGYMLGRFRSERDSDATLDLRCDLHPRWMPDGLSISIDSIHEGFRAMYWVDLREFMGREQTISPGPPSKG